MEKLCLRGILTQKHRDNTENELSNLVKKKTSFKNMQNPSCPYLLLTNNVYAFQQTMTISTVLSDCDKLVFSVFRN